jgi:hypothetical protein
MENKKCSKPPISQDELNPAHVSSVSIEGEAARRTVFTSISSDVQTVQHVFDHMTPPQNMDYCSIWVRVAQTSLDPTDCVVLFLKGRASTMGMSSKAPEF